MTNNNENKTESDWDKQLSRACRPSMAFCLFLISLKLINLSHVVCFKARKNAGELLNAIDMDPSYTKKYVLQNMAYWK